MAEKKSAYHTRQHGELLGYLRSIPGQHVTVAEICRHFKEQGRNIGTTTVYRQLERFLADGLVQKYIIDSQSPACFSYVGEEEQHSAECCFHCKCEKCGKLIHLHCEELSELAQHLMEKHHFQLDAFRTVFYGICEECQHAS